MAAHTQVAPLSGGTIGKLKVKAALNLDQFLCVPYRRVLDGEALLGPSVKVRGVKDPRLREKVVIRSQRVRLYGCIAEAGATRFR